MHIVDCTESASSLRDTCHLFISETNMATAHGAALFAIGKRLLHCNQPANNDTMLMDECNACLLPFFTHCDTIEYEPACLIYDVNKQVLYLYVNDCFCFQLSPSTCKWVCLCLYTSACGEFVIHFLCLLALGANAWPLLLDDSC